MSIQEKMAQLRLPADQQQFLEQVRQVMESYFGTDIRRIAHAHDVTNYVLDLLQYIDADPVVAVAAGYLHDIGILEAERKYGNCNGKLQEQEGPPVAQMLLADVGAEEGFNAKVCRLVGHHHTANGVDSPEFRILWDADALVNLAEVVTDMQPHTIDAVLAKALVTEPGYRIAKKIYLP